MKRVRRTDDYNKKLIPPQEKSVSLERPWRFVDWVTPEGVNHFAEWVVSLREKHKAYMDVRLTYLASTPVWTRPTFDWLRGVKYKKIGEIRYAFKNVPHRPLGCASVHERQVWVLLIGCTKADGVYDPRAALDIAAERREKYVAGKGSIVERRVP